MSFYSGPRGISPGEIEGNPINGLRHRAAVNVERVLDSAMRKETVNSATLTLSGFSPANPTPPFTFISANSVNAEAIITNLTISRLEERSSFARIKCDITIPLRVVFKDSLNVIVTADSQITVTEDLVMYVPRASAFPFEVKAIASCNCPTGTFTDHTTLSVTACITVIENIVAKTCLLIPVYGFCPAPQAVLYEREVCTDFFDLPLYPSGN